MPVHLVLRLVAPFASAGTVAGEEARPTTDAPTRSMVLGLIGNALGLDRTCRADMERLNRLQAATLFSTVVLSSPGRWMDVQNNRVPSASLERAHLKPKEPLQPGDVTERLLAGGRISDHPLAYGFGDQKEAKNMRELLHKASRQRSKHYLTGLRALVALSPSGMWPEAPEGLADALRQPARALWIGRKSCPPSAPIWLQQPLVEATSGPEALLRTLATLDGEQDGFKDGDGPAILWWEGLPEAGGDAAASLKIKGGFPTSIVDRRDWVQGLHTDASTLLRGTIAIPGRADA